MKTYLGLITVAALAIQLSACNNKDDSAPAAPKPSVLGHSKKPGVLPDGTNAPALTKEEFTKTIASLKGTTQANSAVGKAVSLHQGKDNNKNRVQLKESLSQLAVAISENTLNVSDLLTQVKDSSQELVKELAEAKPKSDINIEPKNDPTDEEMQKKWSEDMAKSCTFDIKEMKMSGSGNENSGTAEGSGWVQLKGKDCLVLSQTKMNASFNFHKTGDQAMEAGGAMDFAMDTESNSKELTEQTGYISSGMKGRFAGNLATNPNAMAVVANAKFTGNSKTTNHPELSGEILLDLGIALQKDARTNEGKVSSMQIDIAVILKSGNTVVLLQIFVMQANATAKPEVKIYLNGSELKQDELGKMPSFLK